MEKQSGLELDWYKEYWVGSTHQINYAVTRLDENSDGKTQVSIDKLGVMPMPLDVTVTYTNGQKEVFYIPLRMMRGEKPAEEGIKRTVLADWPWTHPSYTFLVPAGKAEISSVEIDTSQRMADLDRTDNVLNQ